MTAEANIRYITSEALVTGVPAFDALQVIQVGAGEIDLPGVYGKRIPPKYPAGPDDPKDPQNEVGEFIQAVGNTGSGIAIVHEWAEEHAKVTPIYVYACYAPSKRKGGVHIFGYIATKGDDQNNELIATAVDTAHNPTDKYKADAEAVLAEVKKRVATAPVPEVDLDLGPGFAIHMTSNHYPAIPRDFWPFIQYAVQLCQDEEFDTKVTLPNWVEKRAGDIVTETHCEGYLSNDEFDDEFPIGGDDDQDEE